MLFIQSNNETFQKALDFHYRSVRCLIRKKIGESSNCKNSNCRICKSRIELVYNIPEILKPYLKDEEWLKLIICGDPQVLIEIDKLIWGELLPGFTYHDWKSLIKKNDSNLKSDDKLYKYLIKSHLEVISKIFDYENWFATASPRDQYSAYHLAEKLDRRSCTYCNRTYTTTMISVNGSKLMRPQFDHWFPKTLYPLLSLSLYNLIPCCSICNSSIKGDFELNLEDHVHPYIDINQTNDFSFSYKLEGINRYYVHLQSSNQNEKSKRTLEKLKIDQMYNSHHEELDDLIKIRKAYSPTYINQIQKFFPNNGLSYNDIYRLLFGTEFEMSDFHKRPLSKFKKDILKELEVIDKE